MDRLAPGVLFLYLLYAVVLTVPVSLILIWRYRRAIGRSMAAATEVDTPVTLQYAASLVTRNAPPDILDRAERRVRRRVIVVYLLAGFSAALLWTFLMFSSGGIDFTPLRGFSVCYTYSWPIIPTLITLLVLDRKRAFGLLAGYVVLGFLVTVLWSAVAEVSKHTDTSALTNGWQTVRLIALEASLPGLILLITANRRIRGVTPLVLAALLVFTFSAVFVNEFFIILLDRGGMQRLMLAFGATWWNLWFMLATVPVGYLCWRLVILLDRRFEKKSFSDLQFLTDTYWIIAAFVISASLATSLGRRGLWGLAGFAVYRAVASIGFAIWRLPKEEGVRLLVLRVFGFQSRSEKLFDSVAMRWRFRGPVRMIAGTDLAARTIDPEDSLAFASGNLPSRFVSTAEDLGERLRQVDDGRDPDGRFRVTKFFCNKNTWMPSLVALLARSDVILMDLRGFNKQNAGCLFELQQLTAGRRLTATVFVVDSSTDLELLSATVHETAPVTERLQMERLTRDSLSERERVYGALHATIRRQFAEHRA